MASMSTRETVVMIHRLLIVLLLLSALPARANERAILVLGDSLSAAHGINHNAGWVALLAARLAKQKWDYRVVNASISGDTTGGGLARLPAALDRYHPVILIVELGGNDGLRGIPLAEIRSHLGQIVRLAKHRGIRVLLIGVRLPPNYGTVFTERFQALFHEVAQAEAIPLVPKLLAGVAENPQLMQPDGIHPTAAAQPRLLANVWPKLKPLLQPTPHVPLPPAAQHSLDPNRMR
ncbi:probable esterase signal peptide protein [Nitrococcus mobilis Nb-231]|uniref:Probable esterase signal peptide protein n=2 Tax=Nitrococcus mobilis TaxID=35797 RepID=A4BVM6_9GAMM|nr:probable esterase signal peptide protein [Nitrococcus mobilis Nb-231]